MHVRPRAGADEREESGEVVYETVDNVVKFGEDGRGEYVPGSTEVAPRGSEAARRVNASLELRDKNAGGAVRGAGQDESPDDEDYILRRRNREKLEQKKAAINAVLPDVLREAREADDSEFKEAMSSDTNNGGTTNHDYVTPLSQSRTTPITPGFPPGGGAFSNRVHGHGANYHGSPQSRARSQQKPPARKPVGAFRPARIGLPKDFFAVPHYAPKPRGLRPGGVGPGGDEGPQFMQIKPLDSKTVTLQRPEGNPFERSAQNFQKAVSFDAAKLKAPLIASPRMMSPASSPRSPVWIGDRAENDSPRVLVSNANRLNIVQPRPYGAAQPDRFATTSSAEAGQDSNRPPVIGSDSPDNVYRATVERAYGTTRPLHLNTSIVALAKSLRKSKPGLVCSPPSSPRTMENLKKVGRMRLGANNEKERRADAALGAALMAGYYGSFVFSRVIFSPSSRGIFPVLRPDTSSTYLFNMYLVSW